MTVGEMISGCFACMMCFLSVRSAKKKGRDKLYRLLLLSSLLNTVLLLVAAISQAKLTVYGFYIVLVCTTAYSLYKYFGLR